MRTNHYAIIVVVFGGLLMHGSSSLAAGCPTCVIGPGVGGVPCSGAPVPLPAYFGPPLRNCAPYSGCVIYCRPGLMDRLRAMHCKHLARRAAKLACRISRHCGNRSACGSGTGCSGYGGGYGWVDGVPVASNGYLTSDGYVSEGGTVWNGVGNEEVIYDGPAQGYQGPISQPGEVIYDGPAAGYQGSSEEQIQPGQTGSAYLEGHNLIRLVSDKRRDGSAEFLSGLDAYRSLRLTEALEKFEQAVSLEPENALYHYHIALAMYGLYGADAAQDALQKAIAAERREAIPKWGKLMERVQGQSRLWIERARRDAGLVR